MNDNKALEALERLYKSHAENNFAPFPTRSDLDTIRLALTELAEIKKRAESIPNFLTGYLVDGNSMQEIVDSVTKSVKNYILKGETK